MGKGDRKKKLKRFGPYGPKAAKLYKTFDQKNSAFYFSETTDTELELMEVRSKEISVPAREYKAIMRRDFHTFQVQANEPQASSSQVTAKEPQASSSRSTGSKPCGMNSFLIASSGDECTKSRVQIRVQEKRIAEALAPSPSSGTCIEESATSPFITAAHDHHNQGNDASPMKSVQEGGDLFSPVGDNVNSLQDIQTSGSSAQEPDGHDELPDIPLYVIEHQEVDDDGADEVPDEHDELPDIPLYVIEHQEADEDGADEVPEEPLQNGSHDENYASDEREPWDGPETVPGQDPNGDYLLYTTDTSADTDIDDKLDFMTARKLQKKLIDLQAKHPGTSLRMMKDVWKLLKEFENSVLKYLPIGIRANRKIRSHYLATKKEEKVLPQIYLDVTYLDTRKPPDNQLVKEERLKSFPSNLFKDRKYKLEHVSSYCKVADVLELVRRVHKLPETGVELFISADEIPESKCKSKSLVVVSLAIPQCFRKPLPLLVSRSQVRNKYMNSQELLKDIIQETNELGHRIKFVQADKVMRSFLACQKSHAGYYTCEICDTKGEQYKEDSMPKGKVIFPNDPNARKKTHAQVVDIMEKLDSGERRANQAGNLGYLERSSLIDIEGFDICRDLVIDYMHHSILGISRKIFQLTFKSKVPGLKTYMIKRARLDLDPLRERIRFIQTPVEFNRANTENDYTQLKAEQWRNHAVLYCPLIIKYIRTKDQELADLWVAFFVTLRTYCMDDYYLAKVNAAMDVPQINEVFSELWPQVFGRFHMSYNFHMFAAHMKDIRSVGMFTDLSNFPSEGMYSLMKLGYRAGTRSIGAQAIKRVHLRWHLDHTCHKIIKFRERVNMNLQCANSFVYTKDYDFYVIKDTYGNNSDRLRVHPVKVVPYFMRFQNRHIDLSSLGVFTFEGIITDSELHVKLADVEGKVIQMENVIVTCPKFFLLEST